jgi:nicotinamide mononucleotide (NMN) deamidase PncC
MNHDLFQNGPPSITPNAVVALLAQADIQLAIAELGTAGTVAAALRETDVRGRITSATVFPDAPALAAALRISEAKMAAFGAVSAMVAAEAAAALIDTYEGGWGLAVLCGCGNCGEGGGVTSVAAADAGCFLALGTPASTEVAASAPGELIPTALALLKSAAEIRLATRREF